MDTTNEVLFENLDYGAYALVYDAGRFEENVKYGTAEFNKLYTRRIRLPDGKGNVIYLLSSSFLGSLSMISPRNFIIPTTYRYLYYPWYLVGKFMGKRYTISINTADKKSRSALIKEKTKLQPYATRTLTNGTTNVFFSGSDIYDAFKGIMEKMTVKKNYDSFFKEYIDLILSKSPTPNEKFANDPNSNRRVLIIDADSFKFDGSGKPDDNKTNPLYLLYLAYLRNRDMSKMNIDMDILICAKNLFIKFNPMKADMKTWPIFRKALFRIMNVNLDAYIDNLPEEDKGEIDISAKDHTISAVVNDVIDPYTKFSSPSTKAVLADAVERKVKQKAAETAAISQATRDTKAEISKALGSPVKKDEDIFTASLKPDQTSVLHFNPGGPPMAKKGEELFKAIGGYQAFTTTTGQMIDDDEDDEDFDRPPEDEEELGEYEDALASDSAEVLSTDQEIVAEVLDEIQDKIVPMKNPKTAPINSARDQKLREEQKRVVVKNASIEEILARESSNVPLQSSNKASVMHSSNQNMQTVTFANFEKTYLNELYDKDIVACFDMLKDKPSPFYITGIEVRDTSNTEDLKDTWSVHLVDETGKKHTMRIDIPKFLDDRFMFLQGTKYIILMQNFYNPLVKDTPDTVILTTDYNKITIQRKATKSLNTVERIFSLIKKTGDSKMFTSGDSSRSNVKYLSTLEYDEISRRLFKFTTDSCEIWFSRDFIKENLSDKIPSDMKGKEFFIGIERGNPILINEDTALDRQGRTIAEIISQNLPPDYQAIFNSIKGPTQSMYVEAKMSGRFIPVITALIVWEGITATLNRMGIYWKFIEGTKRVPQASGNRKYIKFSNGILEYESQTFAELILNGLAKMKPEAFMFQDFESEVGYGDFMYAQWGSYSGITQIKNFYDFLIDPVAKCVCRDLFLPQDASGLLIHAVKLLCDNAYVSKANDNSYRVRSIEMIPGILYSLVSKQYQTHIQSGRRIPMTLNQRALINRLLKEKTVETYSTLNPATEVSKTHTISTKGYRGSNSEHSYDEEKRSYDPSAVGKLAISTSADANVGINKSLVIEPTIINARGYRQQIEDPENELKDVNIFSPIEMLTPGTARNDDPIRTAIAAKQSQHVVPVKDAAPALVSNGFDEAVQFHLSSDFVINAEEDGKVIDVNEELGFIVVQYVSGETRAISTKPSVVHNSGGGFYVSNYLTPTKTKVGEKFKKDEPLAYHDKFFRYSKMNGLRYAIGPIAKMAIMSSYNTYEDAGICTAQLADRMKTSIVYNEKGRFKKNNNILSMVSIGDHVNIGDPLIKFDVSVEDNELAKYLTRLSDDNADFLEEETRSEIKAGHAGKVIDIKVYTLLDPSNLSESLGRVVQQYFDQGNAKKEFLSKYDASEGTIKAGYMLTDSTAPIKNPYNTINGNKGVDVLIEIYIEHEDVMGVGDKIALYGPNKQIVSEVIPEGWEPYSEFRPDEEISVLTSPGTIARRMTPSIIPIGAAMKCMIELKRKIAAEIKYK